MAISTSSSNASSPSCFPSPKRFVCVVPARQGAFHGVDVDVVTRWSCHFSSLRAFCPRVGARSAWRTGGCAQVLCVAVLVNQPRPGKPCCVRAGQARRLTVSLPPHEARTTSSVPTTLGSGVASSGDSIIPARRPSAASPSSAIRMRTVVSGGET